MTRNTPLKPLSHFFKANLFGLISTTAHASLASDKMAAIILSIFDNSNQLFVRLMAAFIAVESDPQGALERLRRLIKSGEGGTAVSVLILQRLYAYYRTRPLLDNLKRNFEDVIAEIEIGLKNYSRQAKGKIIQDVQKQAYSDSRD